MENITLNYNTVLENEVITWFNAGKVEDFSADSGSCVKYKNLQISVFNDERNGKWYACQNLCPHKLEMVLSRGILGSSGEVPKIACPLHKKTFSLEDGSCLSGDQLSIAIYPVVVKDGSVFIGFKE